MTFTDDDDTLPNLPRIVRTAIDPLWGAATSIGLTRAQNEDNYGIEANLFVVADGMGGLEGGKLASAVAVAGALARGRAIGLGASTAEWESSMVELSGDVADQMSSQGFAKAGTTLSMLVVEPHRVLVLNSGDSRVYRVDAGGVELLTVDHNLENDLKSLGGDIADATKRGLPLKGLTAFIGRAAKDTRVDVQVLERTDGVRYVLCSDGVHGQLEPSMFAAACLADTPQQAADTLVGLADAAGGRDNATALVVEL